MPLKPHHGATPIAARQTSTRPGSTMKMLPQAMVVVRE